MLQILGSPGRSCRPRPTLLLGRGKPQLGALSQLLSWGVCSAGDPVGLLAHSGNDLEPALPSQPLGEQKGPAMRGWGCFCRMMGSEASGRFHRGFVKPPAVREATGLVLSSDVPHHSMSLKTQVVSETCLPLRTFAQDGPAPRDAPCSSQAHSSMSVSLAFRASEKALHLL